MRGGRERKRGEEGSEMGGEEKEEREGKRH
jgi:hypothetical protein